MPYDGNVRAAVLALKNGNDRRLASDLANLLIPLVDVLNIDVITWAPTTKSRAHSRGYDHAELIARSLGKKLGVPTRKLLRRDDGVAQQGKNRAARLVGPRVTATPAARGKRILIVDDVVTTGATLMACRDALINAGARSVEIVAVAGARN